jgi:hypothetical protein
VSQMSPAAVDFVARILALGAAAALVLVAWAWSRRISSPGGPSVLRPSCPYCDFALRRVEALPMDAEVDPANPPDWYCWTCSDSGPGGIVYFRSVVRPGPPPPDKSTLEEV